MKKIEAIIKPFLLEEVKEALQEIGHVGITVSEIKDFRPPEPVAALPTPGDGADGQVRAVDLGGAPVAFTPRLKLEIVVPSTQCRQAVDCVLRSARLGHDLAGDVTVQELNDVVRIRTDEHGECAI